MKKKFICTVCGYIYEGTEAPEKCPVCKAPASKFKELEDPTDGPAFATVHTLGAARKEDATAEMIKDLETHFNGECGEVGMYLAMSRQADREGYPEIAEAFKRYAFEEAEHASKFAELLGDVLKDTRAILRHVLLLSVVHARTSSVSQRTLRLLVWMLHTTQFMRWQRTRLVIALASWDCTSVISVNNQEITIKKEGGEYCCFPPSFLLAAIRNHGIVQAMFQ